jgi:MoaA/NifB/PqqE/SkfB family radical SAM enzyme
LLEKINNTLIGRESFCDTNELAAFFSINKRRVVIYFTFGTAAGTSEAICDAIRCLLDNGVAVVTTINVGEINKIQKELYFYSPFLPMHYVCSRVNGMVHHCGSGTYQFALLYQLPTITIGTRCHDREDVALKLEELGVSQHLSAPSECTDFVSRFDKTFESAFDPSGSWLIKARTNLIELKEESQKAMRNFEFEKILEEASARKEETKQVSISLRLTDVLSAMSKFKEKYTEPPQRRLFDVEVTRRCNLRCKFCPRDDITNQVDMEQDTFRNFLKNGQLHPADTIAFCGLGEPLLHPLLPEYLRQLKKSQPGINAGIITNGTLLSQRTLPPLLDNGIDFIYVSFNGITPETYENLMKGASFESTLKKLEYTFNEIHKRHLHTTSLQVIYLLSIENLQEKEKINQFWSSRGITSVPHYIHSRGGFVKIEEMTPIDDSGFQNQKSCSVFKSYNYVGWNGNILSCCHDVQQNHVFGNINNERMEIITSRKQYAMDHNKWPKLCYKCNDFSRRPHIE